jgi:predicted nucleotidyltransferase
MTETRPDRTRIVDALRQRLEPDERVLALWEGGSAAWGRLDDLSDLDLLVLVRDDAAEGILGLLDACLEAISPIATRFRLPAPTWHGHEQCFYRLRDCSEFLILDVVVMHESAPDRFLERERHGEGIVVFDKTGQIVPARLDRIDFRSRVERKLDQLEKSFPLFQSLVRKEALRGHDLDALAFYQSQTLAPLLTVLRIRHCPERFDFGLRYVERDLPADVVRHVRRLWFVGNLGEILSSQRQAEELFFSTLGEIRRLGVRL